MEIKEYRAYNEADILRLYESVGWTAYTDHPEVLRKGFENSMLILTAYEGDQLLGIIRAVGDGYTVYSGHFGIPGVSEKRHWLCTPASHIGQIQPCAPN